MRIRSTVAGVIALIGIGTLGSPAAADPAVSPPTRTAACRSASGPENAACRDVPAGAARSDGPRIANAAGRHRAIVPDGQLCGAGTATYAALNAARADWPATSVTSGQRVTFRFPAVSRRLGVFTQYVTRADYRPERPLRWADLEPLTEVDSSRTWTVALPERSGRHVVYTIWQRTDGPEAAYSCTDLAFETTPERAAAAHTVAPVPTEPAPDPDVTGSTAAGPSCAATIRIEGTWPGGFLAQVTVVNTGREPIDGWTLGWTLPSGTKIVKAWNAAVTQGGTTVTAKAPSWNRTLAAGRSASIGFTADGEPGPTEPTLGGTPCG